MSDQLYMAGKILYWTTDWPITICNWKNVIDKGSKVIYGFNDAKLIIIKPLKYYNGAFCSFIITI